MKKLLHASILVFAFCFCTFAQTSNATPCPAISVIGPAEIADLNEPIIFTVSIDEKAKNYNITYSWSISSGEIVEGQGTQVLKVLPNPGKGVTAAIEISGLPVDCINSASESYIYCVHRQPMILDEFSETISRINYSRIKALTAAVQNDPTAQLYIVSKFKGNISQQKINRKHKEISDLLINAGIEKDRITFIHGFVDIELTQIWLVPAGTEPPKIDK